MRCKKCGKTNNHSKKGKSWEKQICSDCDKQLRVIVAH